MSLNFRVSNSFQTKSKLRLMTKVTKKISFADQEIYVGIDVHKNQWVICVLTEQVNFRAFSINPDPEILIS